MNIGMKISGMGWKDFPSYLRGYSRNISIADKMFLYHSSTKYLELVRKRIDEQPSDIPLLSPMWKAMKKKMGLDPRIWVATGEFKRKLRIIQIRKGVVFAGATKAKHKSSGKTMEQLAELLEHGDPTKHLPPRPLFGPAARQMLKEIPKIKTEVGIFLSSMKK